MTARKGDWIQTWGGRQFWPLDPRPEEIDPIDVAAALAKECRYGGHCLRFYSVAEHSELMRRYAKAHGASARTQRAVLFHDASEGLGLRDIPRPIKADLTNYRELESGVMAAVAIRFDFEWPLSMVVKDLDERIGLAEEAQNMAPAPAKWREHHLGFKADRPLDVRLQFWTPDQAFAEFMRGYAECREATR